MPIVWQPAMSAGIKSVDNEHKYLFALVNCVELALKTGDVASIALFIDQLTDYCREHFRHEEQLQLRIKYPYYLENKTQHQEILENLHQLRQRLQLPEASTGGPERMAEIADYDPDGTPHREGSPAAVDETLHEEITALLRKWVLEHVLVVDRKMHPFLTRLPAQQLRKLLAD